MLVLLPLALTLIIVSWVVVLVHDLVGPSSPFGSVLRSVGLSLGACDMVAYLIGVAGTLGVIHAVGFLVEHRIGLRYQRALEIAVEHVRS